jgi:hypothetical protein
MLKFTKGKDSAAACSGRIVVRSRPFTRVAWASRRAQVAAGSAIRLPKCFSSAGLTSEANSSTVRRASS